MKLFHIVGMAQNRIIGNKDALPWHFSEDLKRFKKITTGSTVLMGRKTFESIGRPLPNRENFVLSRRPGSVGERVQFFKSIEEALANVKTDKCFIMGGGDIYTQTFDRLDGIYLTLIHKDYDGDTSYPAIPDYFKEVSRETLREADPKIEVIFYEKAKS